MKFIHISLFFCLLITLNHSSQANSTLSIPGIGELEGVSGEGYDAYLKIPYAQSPTGDLRWMPPISPINWTNVYNSTNYPSACPQLPPEGSDWLPNVTFSEDCLYLSIWKPQLNSTEKAAVVVWIHGGSYMHGGAARPSHKGQYMAQNQSIIFVLVQYRIGLLGFGALPELKQDNQYHTTGTYGVLDQIAALKWVQNNIGAFGGDPKRVTLAGWSAGATSACLLSVIPQAQGLFNQAIWHSNACWMMTKVPTEAYQQTRNLVQPFCDLNAGTIALLKCMRGLDVNILVNVSLTIEQAMIDGYLLKEHSFLSFKNWGNNPSNNYLSAILMGNTANEGTIFMPESVPNTHYPNYVSGFLSWIPLNSASLTNIVSNYPCSTSECKEQLPEAFGDAGFVCSEVLIAEWFSQATFKTKVFSYVWSHSPDSTTKSNPFFKANHGSDIAFALNNVPATYGNYTAEEITLSNQMANTWAQFIKGNFSELPQFNSTTDYLRINLTTPATTPYPLIKNWKHDVCNNVWLPIYEASLDDLVKNDTPISFPTVNLTVQGLGELQGIDGDGYEAYLKIPYAAPPVEKLRWNLPVTPVNWTGLYNSTRFPQPCPQIITSDMNFPLDTQFNEDCLYLSVWKPKTQQTLGNPVVVYIHGGSLRIGSVISPEINGEYMARTESIVFVSIQYRLGTLGFLGLPEFRNENIYKTTGNYGIFDQIAALEWVKNNVAAFGGNPDKITIDGESSGASSVLFHMSMPRSQGLFNQAIAQSNAAYVDIQNPTTKYKLSREIIAKFCNVSENTSTIEDCMRKTDAKTIAAIEPGDLSQAMIDGYLFEEHTFNYFLNWKTRTHNVSAVLMGNTLNEGTIFVPLGVNSSTYSLYISYMFPWTSNYLSQLLTVYPCSIGDCSSAFSDLLGDAWLVCPNILPSQMISNDSNTKIFTYLFSHAPKATNKYNPFSGAYHSSEIPFAFNNVPSSQYFYTAKELNLSNAMAKTWAKFIKGDYSDFPTYSQSTNYSRVNFDVPVTNPYPQINNWKQDVCNNIWLPIYNKVDRQLVNNQTKPNGINGTVNLTISDNGKLKGLNASDYEAFLKVPYAKPPIKNLRFMPPQSMDNWTDVYDSIEYPSACPQPYNKLYWMDNVTFDEDCLYLSIWKPKNLTSSPVIVWFTGTYQFGGSKQYSHMGQYMAQKESTVFVLVQYRLGLLGFLGTPELKKNNSLNTTGNYGLLDQIAALKWIKKYISAFGGDPNQITLGGSSQGSASICLHMIMPQSQGLFNQTILHSFECFNHLFKQDDAYKRYRTIIALKCDVNANSSTLLDCLRSIDYDTYANAPIDDIGPMIDDYLLKEHPYITYKSLVSRNQKLNVTAILLGNNANEGTIFVSTSIPSSLYVNDTYLYNRWINPLDLEKILPSYPCVTPECQVQLAEMVGDANFICPSTLISQWVSNLTAKPKVFSFVFSHPTASIYEQNPFYGAFWSGDISYAWHNIPTSYEYYTVDEAELSDTMSKIWGQFVRGNYSNLLEYSQDKGYRRNNFTTPIVEPFNVSTNDNWKQNLCVNTWMPAYQNAFGGWINNDTNANGGRVLSVVIKISVFLWAILLF